MRIFLSTIQWIAFILVNAIVVPIVIGEAFGLSPQETADFLQRTLFVLGVAGLLQVLFGHKLPITEGPAGLWWGIFIVYAGLASSGVLEGENVLRQLEAAMLISGVFFIILGLFKLVDTVKKLFTPLITGTFLILLVSQLSGSFIKGILGVGYLSDVVQPKIAIPAIAILVLAILFSRSRISFIRTYSILISLGIGWFLFYLLGLTKPLIRQEEVMSIPKLFVFGIPEFTIGIFLTAIMTTMLLLANMVASIAVIENVIKNEGKKVEKINYNRSSIVAGINQMLSGSFAAIGSVPLSVTAGFLMTTRTVDRLPFVLASISVILISLFPSFTSITASIPSPVGYAVVFITISSLAALGVKQYQLLELTEQQLFIISMSLMVGIGSLFVTAESLLNLPEFIISVANNGLILGTLTCIILEQTFIYLNKIKKA